MSKESSPLSLDAFLRRGASASFLIKVSSTGMAFVTGIFLARVLGPEHYGIYAYAMAAVTLLAVPSALGLPALIVRQVSAYRASDDWALLRGLLRRSNQMVALVVTVLTLVAVLLAWLLAPRLPEQGLATFLVALTMVPLLAFATLRVAALQGLHHVVLAQLPEALLRPGLFLAGAVALYAVLGRQFDPVWAMIAHATATAFAFAVGAWLLTRRRPVQSRQAPPRYRTREWLVSAWPMLFVTGANMAHIHIDLLMLGLFTTSHDVGIYRVASRGAEIVLFVLIAANLTAAPVFSNLYYRNQRVELQRVVTLTVRMVTAFALPVALFLMLWGEPLLRLLFGEAYVGAALALAILAGGQLVNAGLGSVGTLLNMTGHERASARAAAVSVTANIALNASLIPLWGINGAAVATAISIALWNVLMALAVRRHLRIDVTALAGLLRPRPAQT